MKKIDLLRLILFLVATYFLCGVAFSQSNSAHLTFKGVPIDGTITECVNELKKKGFSYIGETEGGISKLNGNFAGYRDCLIGVFQDDATQKVNLVVVFFPKHDNWSTLIYNYNRLKSMLSTKYGEPSTCIEKFQDYEPETDEGKFNKILFDSCTWFSTFSTDKGDIELSLDKAGRTQCKVILKYFDKLNSEKKDAAAIEDL